MAPASEPWVKSSCADPGNCRPGTPVIWGGSLTSQNLMQCQYGLRISGGGLSREPDLSGFALWRVLMGWRKWTAIGVEIGGAMLPRGLSAAALKAAEMLRKKEAEMKAAKDGEGEDFMDTLGPATWPGCVFRKCPTRERCAGNGGCLSPEKG